MQVSNFECCQFDQDFSQEIQLCSLAHQLHFRNNVGDYSRRHFRICVGEYRNGPRSFATVRTLIFTNINKMS